MQNRLKIQQILAAIGSHAEPQEADETAHDVHDWHQVRYFDQGQLQAVEDLGHKAAPLFAAALKRAFREDFVVEWSQVHETSTSQYKEQMLENNTFLAFQTKDDAAVHGALALPMAAVQDWATRLMGESTEEREAGTLSPLEITLVSDIAISLIDAFSSSYMMPFQALPPLSVSHLSTPVEDTDELCSMGFTFKREKAESDASQTFSMVMPCVQLVQTLEGLVHPVAPSEGKLSEALHGHVDNIPVQITAEFASTRLTLEQAMDLTVGDVLLMDKDLDDPMVLKINNRLVFYGKPVQCEDHYGVMVTDHAES
jgi:flagellar motor switch protein FliM